MRVAEIMSPRVRTIGPAESAELAWDRMRMHQIHHLVVVHDTEILGIITERDLGSKHGESVRQGRSVRDLMTPRAITAAPHATVRAAANLMRGHRSGSLAVVDEGRLVGIVTVWDFLDLLGRGADRPIAHINRWLLRDRGKAPHASGVAKLTSRAKSRTSR